MGLEMLRGKVQLPGFLAGLTGKERENGIPFRDLSSLAELNPDGMKRISVQNEGIHPGLILAQPSEIDPLKFPTGPTLRRRSSARSVRADKIVCL